jgi:hypothetical protein
MDIFVTLNAALVAVWRDYAPRPLGLRWVSGHSRSRARKEIQYNFRPLQQLDRSPAPAAASAAKLRPRYGREIKIPATSGGQQ